MIPKTENPQEAKKVSIRVSLRGMLRLIRVDTLRRDHNVGFLAGRLIYQSAKTRNLICHLRYCVLLDRQFIPVSFTLYLAE